MNQRPFVRTLILALFLILPALIIAISLLTPLPAVRGKSAALPITGDTSPAQVLAQDLALSDSRVQEYTRGRRAEVFGVRRVGNQFTEASRACATAACWQVEIYIFDQNATVLAIVNVEAAAVLDVLYQPGVHPGVNQRLNDLALELALNDPDVIETLGYRPVAADMAPMDAGLVNSTCAQGHLCLAPTFTIHNRALWAIVDLMDEQVVQLAWTNLTVPGGLPTPNAPILTPVPPSCPEPGSVSRAGWSLNYENTYTDGLRVYDVSYNGTPVLTSVKLAEWHADYGTNGYEDSAGCGGGGGGSPIYPYGETLVLDLLDEQNNVIGFEVVQDFRMNGWGGWCSYRYEQHIQFFDDGRYRVVSGSYGKGCGNNPIYRPLVRIDLAIADPGNDSFAIWDGMDWAVQAVEGWWLQGEPYTPEGYKWRVTDQGGQGYYVEPGQGQFGDGGRGDNAFIYAVQHHPAEGDTDLGMMGDCCLDDYQQGPHLFLNGESIENEDIVIWYVPQMQTDVTPGSYYCWTVQGDPNPETYPCFSGPMFLPTSIYGVSPAAGFAHNSPVTLGETAVFTNTSTGSQPMTYTWDFGDGTPPVSLTNPTHDYTAAGAYTVTLTTTNQWGSSTVDQTFTVLPPNQLYLPYIER
ncbi:MAG: PKD domain-containing protein [Chloroflexota bacterium]